MHHAIQFVLAAWLVSLGVVPGPAQSGKPPEPQVAATVETTLNTASGQIRQLAFDGDPDTYFASARHAGTKDHFTLVLDQPVALQAVVVTTGRGKDGDQLDSAVLEVSADGQKFEPVAEFKEGFASAKPNGRQVRAIRIRPTLDLTQPLVIREFAITSQPAVATFRYPVEFVVDVSDAPELKDWADRAARLCERWYPRINEELQSEGFKPPQLVKMNLTTKYKGVAMAGGNRITGSVQYFKKHPRDVGAMIHETVHIVQRYRTRNNPGWLVEGVADYIRFFKYEPGNLGPINPKRARYNGSYRVTAAFLNYTAEKYDKELVRKLNKMMREGEYKESAFKVLTGKTVQELDEEWRATLQPKTAVGGKVASDRLAVSLSAATLMVLAQDQGKPKPAGKLVSVEMRDRPWRNVFEWLTEVSGLPVNCPAGVPTGTFTFVSAAGKKYSLPEVIDILNEGLLNRKYLLIRSERSFHLVTADDKFDPTLIPLVPLHSLAARGKTELTSVIISPTTLLADDIAPEIKKLASPFGEVIALSAANKLYLRDLAGNLRIIVSTLEDMEARPGGAGATLSYKCRYIQAVEAEKLLHNLLATPKSALKHKAKLLAITADERTNTVFVHGSAEAIALAKNLLKEIDVSTGQGPLVTGPPVLKTYQVANGGAEVLAKLLQEKYKDSPNVKVSAVSPSTLMVYGAPEVHLHIAQQLPAAAVVERVPLTGLDPTWTADTLRGMFGDAKAGGPFIAVDVQRNALIVRGSAEQLQEIRQALQVLGEGAHTATSVRTFTVEGGSAVSLAEALRAMLVKMRANPVKVIVPTAEPEAPAGPQPPKKLGTGKKDGKPLSALPPITITAVANKLIVATEDKQALTLVAELLDLLKAPAGEGDFEVIRLKYGKATHVAQLLDEAFNGVVPARSGFSGPGKGTGATARIERARIIADPVTNSVIVRANLLDMFTIRRLLARTLDHADAGDPGVPTLPGEGKFEVIALKNAKAAAVALILDEVFNGPKGGRGFAPGAARTDRLRVVADPATNSLIVRASPVDVEVIRQLLLRSLDVPGAGESRSGPGKSKKTDEE